MLPGRAEAAVNFRLLPGDTHATRVEAHVAQDASPTTRSRSSAYPGNSEPSPVAPTDAPGYRAIEQHGAPAASPTPSSRPGLMIGGDRLAPLRRRRRRRLPASRRCARKPEDLTRFHGTNERISIANYAEMIQFYHQLLRNAAQPQ